MPFYERQPYIQPLPSLLLEVIRGEIRVPRFQRPGTEITWSSEQRGDLLDSVYRGFPIGTILLWSTEEGIPTMPRLGGFEIPPEPERPGPPRRLMLDGHQRLSTLVATLGLGISENEVTPRGENLERWYFDLSEPENKARRSRDRFVLPKQPPVPDEPLLPLEIALNRIEVNRWLREHELSDAQVLMADSLRDRLREYNIPVAVLATDSLGEATESFKRINYSGTPLDDFHMVAALAFGPDVDLSERFASLREERLAPVGWDGKADLPDSDLLRVCAGLVSKNHPSKLDVTGLARELSGDSALVESAFDSVSSAADLLQQWGIHGPSALPYSWQLITLAILIGRGDLDVSRDEHSDAARRWFWITTYGGVFAGVNSAVYDRASAALKQMADGGDHNGMLRDISPTVSEVERFDFRSVRSKACALSMARHQDHDEMDGAAHRALAENGALALQTVLTEGKRSVWHHLVIVPDRGDLRRIRKALRDPVGEDASTNDLLLLEQHGFTPTADTTADSLLEARRRALLEREKAFVTSIGLAWME